MRTYRVSRILNQRELGDFLNDNPNVIFSIESMLDPDEIKDAPPGADEPLYQPAIRKPRARRKRNVEAIQAAAE